MSCLMRGYQQRDSAILPIVMEALHSWALPVLLLLDTHTEEKPNAMRELD